MKRKLWTMIWMVSALCVGTVCAYAQSGDAYLKEHMRISAWKDIEISVKGAENRASAKAEIKLEGISFEEAVLELHAGETAVCRVEYYPENATDKRLRYRSSDVSVVTLDADGMVLAKGQGEANIMAISADGGHEDVLHVVVRAAEHKVRALLIGAQTYTDGSKDRLGTINSIENLAGMLGSLSLEGSNIECGMLYNPTANDVLEAIERSFVGATEQDESMVYITCHGEYRMGISFFRMSDGSELCAYDLERALRKISGRIVLLADCCGSGGILGNTDGIADFNAGVISPFAGTDGESVFGSSKYRVLTSASPNQDSYRLSFSGGTTEESMATVFVRALCDGAGWNMESGKKGALRGDINYDRKLTLHELWLYANRRVNWYLNIAESLSGTEYVQCIQAFPQNSSAVLFER